MALFKFGYIIRKRREELGLSQEELSDGICSVPTLSRLENGERLPTQNNLERLLQRLGYSDTVLDSFVDEYDYDIHEMKFKICQAFIVREYDLAKTLLAEYERMLTRPSNINEQFLRLYSLLLSGDQYDRARQLSLFEDILRMTCPGYSPERIPPVLSYEEIILLNNIAVCYTINDDRASSTKILWALKNYYDRHIISTEEALRTQPMILYNLSKNLGLDGCYDECIEICELGIAIAQKTGRASFLGGTIFNCAWSMVKRGRPEDIEPARKMLLQAYSVAQAMEQTQSAQVYRNFYEETYGPLSED